MSGSLRARCSKRIRSLPSLSAIRVRARFPCLPPQLDSTVNLKAFFYADELIGSLQPEAFRLSKFREFLISPGASRDISNGRDWEGFC